MDRRRYGRWWGAEAPLKRKAQSRLKRVGAIAALAVLALACSCGFGIPNSKTAYQGDTDTPRHFVVLPVNLTINSPPEFTPVLDDMFGAIAGYIRKRGDSLETFSREEATAGWAASIMEVKASEAQKESFENAMRVYVAGLAKTHSFDGLIAPSLVYRTTKARERKFKWDGVFRKVKFINLSDQAKNKGLARALAVEVPGVSLHVMVFDPDGKSIYQGYGGLDLAHDVDMAGVEFTMRPRLSIKEDVLKESDHLSEGIERAFGSYLPRR